MTTKAKSGLAWCEPLVESGLMPQECRDVHIDLPCNGCGTITFTCNLTPDVIACLHLAGLGTEAKP